MASGDGRRDAARTLAADAALPLVLGALRGRDLPAVVLRGPAIASLLYDAGEVRHHGDLDVLVPAERYEEARAALRSLGFAQEAESGHPGEVLSDHAQTWASEQLGTAVDLHDRIWGIEAAAWDALGAHPREIEAGGARVPVPDAAGTALVVALHAAQHGRDEARVMRDLARAVERLPEGTWREAARRATAAGAARRMGVGLSLDDGGRELAQRLGLGARPVGVMEELMATTPPPGATWMAYVGDLPWRARPRALVRKVVPTPEMMRSRWPAAQDSRAELVRAYVRRAGWAAGRAPAAWRAWRSARARTRRGVS